MRVLEGVWEEIAARAEEFRGMRVRLIVLDMPDTFASRPAPRNWEAFFSELLTRPAHTKSFDFDSLRREHLYEDRI